MTEQWLRTQTKHIPTTDQIRYTSNVVHNNDIYYIKHLQSCTWDDSEIPENFKSNAQLIHFLKADPRNQNGKFYCEIYDNRFLHYRAGSNWEKRNMNLHTELSLQLLQALLYPTDTKSNEGRPFFHSAGCCMQ